MSTNKNITKVMRNITMHAMIERLSEGEKLFQNMTSTDFMFMLILSRHVNDDINKIYIEDLAKSVHMPLRQVSTIVQQLAAQDWVVWKFDGNGDEGTYVEMTETGRYATKKQKEVVENFYNRVVNRFGEQRFIDLMSSVAELEEVMNKELRSVEE